MKVHFLRDPSGNIICDITESELYAIRNLFNGAASPDQQKKAASVIIEKIAGADDLSFRPDEKGGERISSFHEGRRYVGLQVRKLATAPVDRLIDLKQEEKPNERSGSKSGTVPQSRPAARTRRPRRTA